MTSINYCRSSAVILVITIFLAVNLCTGFFCSNNGSGVRCRTLLHLTESDKQILYVIPDYLVPLDSVVNYIQKWSIGASASGSAFKLNPRSDGVTISFIAAPESYLDFDVISVGNNELAISSRLEISSANPQVQSLVKFAALNLIDSLANDIGALMMNVQTPSESNIDAAIRDLSEGNVLGAVDERDTAKMDENDLPSEDDMMGLWKATPISPQKRMDLLAEAMAEREAKNPKSSSSSSPSGSSKNRGRFSSNPRVAAQAKQAAANNIAPTSSSESARASGASVLGTNDQSSNKGIIDDEIKTSEPMEYPQPAKLTRQQLIMQAQTPEQTDQQCIDNTTSPNLSSSSTSNVPRPRAIPSAVEEEESSSQTNQEKDPENDRNDQEMPLKSFTSSPLIVVHSWPRVSVGRDVIIRFVQGWADSFAGRGAGIEAENVDDGVLFYFLIDEECSLRVRVITSGVGAQVTAFVSAPDAGGDNADHGDNKENNRKLVQRAAQNIVDKLGKDLLGLMVTSLGDDDANIIDTSSNLIENAAITQSQDREEGRMLRDGANNPVAFSGTPAVFPASFFGKNGPVSTVSNSKTNRPPVLSASEAMTGTPPLQDEQLSPASAVTVQSSNRVPPVAESASPDKQLDNNVRVDVPSRSSMTPLSGASILDRKTVPKDGSLTDLKTSSLVSQPSSGSAVSSSPSLSSSSPLSNKPFSKEDPQISSIAEGSSSSDDSSTTISTATSTTINAQDDIATRSTPSSTTNKQDIGVVRGNDPSKSSSTRLRSGLSLTPDQIQTELDAAMKIMQQANREAKKPKLGDPVPQRMRDPALIDQARIAGVRLEKFENAGLEEAAVEELQKMMDNTKREGFLAFIKNYGNTTSTTTAAGILKEKEMDAEDMNMGNIVDTSVVDSFEQTASSTNSSAGRQQVTQQSLPLDELFAEGSKISEKSWQELLERQRAMDLEDLSQPPTKLPINLKAGGLSGGIDIFAGPPSYGGEDGAVAPESSLLGQQEAALRDALLVAPDEENLESDKLKLKMLMTELNRTDEFMHENIIDSYRDLLLSDNFLYLLKKANKTTFSYPERLLYRKVTDKAMEVVAELGALVKTESVRHLQTIHDICEVAALYQQDELKFLEKMDYLRPRFDTTLLGYLKYAIEEEKASLRRKSVDPDRVPSTWLQVLLVVQQGVQAEFETRFERLLEPLLLTVRFDGEVDPVVRSDIFRRFVNITPAMDLPYLRELALNMIGGILATPEHQIPDRALYTKMANLQKDVEEYLSEEIVEMKMEELRGQVKAQGQEMLVRHRNPVVQAELDVREDMARRGGIDLAGRITGGVGDSILDPTGRLGKSRSMDEDGVGSAEEDMENDDGMIGGGAENLRLAEIKEKLNNREVTRIGEQKSGISASTPWVRRAAQAATSAEIGAEKMKVEMDDSSSSKGEKVGDKKDVGTNDVKGKSGKKSEEDNENKNKNENKGGDDDKDNKEEPPEQRKDYLLKWG